MLVKRDPAGRNINIIYSRAIVLPGLIDIFTRASARDNYVAILYSIFSYIYMHIYIYYTDPA